MARRISTTLAVIALALGCGAATGAEPSSPDRPNVLWLTSEDNGPHLGAYGDTYATTPHLDGLAEKGILYLHASSNAPVCAPARSTIISGMYPPSIGSQHMRSQSKLPTGAKMYPWYLRRAGYYCTNNSKEDYNLKKGPGVWDESSRRAHWRNRRPGQPFFAIFNYTTTHESQIRRRPHRAVHDPAKVRIPAYHPDTPEARQDWAQYHDKMTEMDAQVGRRLAELEADGLADDTIIFYYGDHGPGMPRSKRWPYASGLHVPMIVKVPPRWQHLAHLPPGSRSDRLVGFIDLAPTLLSIVGIRPPDHFQGHAFLGKFATEAPQHSFGYRGRMDERYDMVRTVLDQRYVYLRHFMPHKIYGQHINYMFQTPTTRVWKQLYDEGKLAPPRTFFWEEKPTEELYDLRSDPDEVRNLAASPEHRQVLERMREALERWQHEIRDVGFLPESEIHRRSEGTTPYEMARDGDRYPLARVRAAAELASARREGTLPDLVALLSADDGAIRYWAALGLRMQKEKGYTAGRKALVAALGDPSPPVRIAAADTLARHGNEAESRRATELLVAELEGSGPGSDKQYDCLLAANALDELGAKALPWLDRIRAAHASKRGGNYTQRVLQTMVPKLEALKR